MRLDKSYSKTSRASDPQANYWKDKTVEERLHAAWYLTCCAYGLEFRFDHKMDKTVVKLRKHSE